MSNFTVNSLWAVVGLPLGLLSFLYHLYSRRQRIELKDKVVFITGASSGLGEACAEAFYNAGCKLVLSGRKMQPLLDLKDRLLQKDPKGHCPVIITIDLENLLSIPSKINQVLTAFGHVDVLINNAGMSYRGTATETKLEVDKKLMDVNFFGHIEVTRAIVPHMIRQKGGQIVVISSIQGRLGIPYRSAYAASKHALQAYFDSLRAELAVYDVNVCVVSPSYIRTKLSLSAIRSDGSVYGKMDETTKSGMEPAFVAKQILDCVACKTNELTLVPLHMKIAIGLRALTPWLYFKLMESRAKKEQAEMQKKS